MQKCHKSNQFREEEKKGNEKWRKRRKLKERMLEDRVIVCEEEVKKARKAPKKVEAPLQVKPSNQKDAQDSLEQIVDQPEEVKVKEESLKKNELKVLEEICRIYIENDRAIKRFTSMNHDKFDAFVIECSPALLSMTYKGVRRDPQCCSSYSMKFLSDEEMEGLQFSQPFKILASPSVSDC
jgi:hypothetical protein